MQAMIETTKYTVIMCL